MGGGFHLPSKTPLISVWKGQKWFITTPHLTSTDTVEHVVLLETGSGQNTESPLDLLQHHPAEVKTGTSLLPLEMQV